MSKQQQGAVYPYDNCLESFPLGVFPWSYRKEPKRFPAPMYDMWSSCDPKLNARIQNNSCFIYESDPPQFGESPRDKAIAYLKKHALEYASHMWHDCSEGHYFMQKLARHFKGVLFTWKKDADAPPTDLRHGDRIAWVLNDSLVVEYVGKRAFYLYPIHNTFARQLSRVFADAPPAYADRLVGTGGEPTERAQQRMRTATNVTRILVRGLFGRLIPQRDVCYYIADLLLLL